jgi:hypothetical protein
LAPQISEHVPASTVSGGGILDSRVHPLNELLSAALTREGLSRCTGISEVSPSSRAINHNHLIRRQKIVALGHFCQLDFRGAGGGRPELSLCVDWSLDAASSLFSVGLIGVALGYVVCSAWCFAGGVSRPPLLSPVWLPCSSPAVGPCLLGTWPAFCAFRWWPDLGSASPDVCCDVRFFVPGTLPVRGSS